MKHFLLFLLLGIPYHLMKGHELSDYLWQQTERERQDALDSVYVRAINNVTLDPVQFGAYLVQDAVFLHYAKRSFEIAARKAKDGTIKSFLQDYAIPRYTSRSTNALEDLHIGDPKSIKLGEGCKNYVNHLLNVAETMEPAYLIIANIPCKRLWPWIGKKLGVGTKDFGMYNKWVNKSWDPSVNAHIDFEKIVEDEFANGKINKEKALEIYRDSMIGEVEFFRLKPFKQEPDVHDEL